MSDIKEQPNEKLKNDDTDNKCVNGLMSSKICLDAALIEYEHTIHRASKLENKVYILSTILSLYSSVVFDITNDVMKLRFPISTIELLVIILCVILFLAILFCYFFCFITILKNLKSIPIQRFDSNTILKDSLYNKFEIAVTMLLAKKYIESTNHNNNVLSNCYDNTNKITQNLVFLVIISSALKLILLFYNGGVTK